MSLKSMSHGQCHSIAPNVFHSTASNVIQLTVSNVNDMLSTNRSMPVKSMDMINITTLSLGVDITDVRVTPVEFLTPNNGAWVDLQPAVPLSIFSTFDEEKQDGARQQCRLTICIELDELTNSIRQQDPNIYCSSQPSMV